MFIDDLNWADADDTQYKKVAAFDRELEAQLKTEEKYKTLSTGEIADLVKKCYSKYGLTKTPKINFNPKDSKRATGSSLTLDIPPWAHTNYTIIHESSHGIAQQKVKAKSYEPHGPEFMGIALNLLSWYFGMDQKELVKRAKDAGIKVAAKFLKESRDFKTFWVEEEDNG